MIVTPFSAPRNERSSNAVTIRLLFQKSWRTWARFFPFLLVTQSFDIVSEATIAILDFLGLRQGSTLMTVAWTLPTFLLPWLSLCFTASFVLETEAGPVSRSSLASAGQRVINTSRKLLVASILAGVLIGVGFLVILPGFYFGWVYSFVPLWVLVLPERSAFDLLQLSKRQALLRRGVSLVAVFGGMSIALILRLLIEVLFKPLIPGPAATLSLFVLSIPIGTLTNLLLIHYFLETREHVYEAAGEPTRNHRAEQPTLDRTALPPTS